MNLSTQFVAQLSSLRSSFLLAMRDVMHFLQQVSVRVWMAVEAIRIFCSRREWREGVEGGVGGAGGWGGGGGGDDRGRR